MKEHIRFILLIYFLIVTNFALRAEQNPTSTLWQSSDSSATALPLPFIGAQVFIEPGQTPEDIDTWFRVLKMYPSDLKLLKRIC